MFYTEICCGIFLLILILIIFYMFKYKNKEEIKDIIVENNILFKNSYYINLDTREDRKVETLKELTDFGIENPKRFNAIKHKHGGIGCSKSHLGVLKEARDNNYPYVAIFEDDVKFLDIVDTHKNINKLLKSGINWDVLLLSGNNYKPYDVINDDLYRVKNCQCCTAYIVKREYYDTLINHWEYGLKMFIQTNDYPKYACDQYWKELQKKDNFLLLVPMKVVQRPDHSDIMGGYVDYESIMKDYN